jgi:hypothetical protein
MSYTRQEKKSVPAGRMWEGNAIFVPKIRDGEEKRCRITVRRSSNVSKVRRQVPERAAQPYAESLNSLLENGVEHIGLSGGDMGRDQLPGLGYIFGNDSIE